MCGEWTVGRGEVNHGFGVNMSVRDIAMLGVLFVGVFSRSIRGFRTSYAMAARDPSRVAMREKQSSPL